MKKSFIVIALMAMTAAAFAQTKDDVPKAQPIKPGKSIETIYGKTQPLPQSKAPTKKAVIEMCDCYEQVKPPCRKTPETPPCAGW